VRERLPVSGLEVEIRQPSGGEDLLLLEATQLDTALGLALAARTATRPDGGDSDHAALPAPDLDALLLHVRRAVFGDVIRATVRCSRGCEELVDVSFDILEYLAHHRPRAARGVVAMGGGWYDLRGALRFRLPTVADLLAAALAERPDRALATACLDPGDAPAPLRRRAERAMAALAPSVVDEVQGTCPACRGVLTVVFDPLRYVLTELRDEAGSVIADVDLLASRYHWSEQQILALPRSRRRAYAEQALELRETA
jgi:hypothetical protein